ncbi:ATPase [Colletotrichum simmondsii]|uniref:ATPase n=1 Tax=Colletotrichum simmondsii TaxID=703756 RepID=A0A135TRR4_9PEZI|nr:ATPase [Colletotrichum simmondsii]
MARVEIVPSYPRSDESSEESLAFSIESARSRSRSPSSSRTRSRTRYRTRYRTRTRRERSPEISPPTSFKTHIRTLAPQDVNEFGVEVRHVTTQFYRNSQGEYMSTKRLGLPSEGENHVSSNVVPRVTFLHDVDEFGNSQSFKIEVDWWEFENFLESLEQFPLDTTVSSRVTKFYSPFVPLFLRLDSLEREVLRTEKTPLTDNKSSTSSHNFGIAKAIVAFIEENAPETKSKMKSLNLADPSTAIQYDDLWMLYKPGQLIFERNAGPDTTCFMVDYPSMSSAPEERDTEWRDGRRSKPKPMTLEIHCWSMIYDPTQGAFMRCTCKLPVVRFRGGIEIAKLRYLPERFVEDLDVVKALALSRGRIFWDINTTSKFRQLANTSEHGGDWLSGTRVIVDRNSEDDRVARSIGHDRHRPIRISSRYNSRYADREEKGDERWPASSPRMDDQTVELRQNGWFADYESISASSEPDELALMLCPRTVTAFSLRSKSWSSCNVVSLDPVEFAADAWKRLVLKTEYKEVIWAMVKSYLAHSTGFKDLVAGKGEGLVILLHGPPGVGKTLTAECVAESFKKPLYMVTAGDLGTDPRLLEITLAEIFERAVAWDAILLLDEADIFLQDRDYDNLQRNALVSIFLRTLEYFNGIMFLTSNRVGAFDQAFQSRIHITIGMPEFDEPLRKEVWKIFIQDLGRKRRDGSPALLSREECKALGSEVTKSWASQPLNGRQIRNCVRSALALAEDKGVKPNASHFNKVLKLGNAFAQYMTKLQKAEAEEIAQIKGDRLAAMKDIMAQSDAA